MMNKLYLEHGKGWTFGFDTTFYHNKSEFVNNNNNSSQLLMEYQNNYDHLTGLIGKPIKVMSHPCGDYNEITLEILKSMKIDIGFRSNMLVKEMRSPLEIPREDHANVFKEMRL